MVDSKHWRKYIGRVAVLADIRRLHMRLVFTGSIRTVVTAHTIAGDVDVIEVRRQPTDCAVTVIAVISAGNMVLTFTSSDYAVMASAAIANDLGVIDNQNRYK